MVNKLYNINVSYFFLTLALIFLAFSIIYFQEHISDIGLKPYSNVSSDKMTSEEKFLLHVKEQARVYLLHNAIIGSGFVEFQIADAVGQPLDEYKLTADQFVNKVYHLDKGDYYCSIIRDVANNKENFRFYFDRRYIDQEYLINDSKTSRSN